jgi:hypothetical protein
VIYVHCKSYEGEWTQPLECEHYQTIADRVREYLEGTDAGVRVLAVYDHDPNERADAHGVPVVLTVHPLGECWYPKCPHE